YFLLWVVMGERTLLGYTTTVCEVALPQAGFVREDARVRIPATVGGEGRCYRPRSENAMTPERNDIRIGTSGWHYEHWRGSFYPKNLSALSKEPTSGLEPLT
ncbi:MAG TPA: hypothetical protein VKA82_15290, partial [Rubrobacter sp.]|nr:hypothetical protein [Rubrobacter sp.]